jgi:hypothetical protein
MRLALVGIASLLVGCITAAAPPPAPVNDLDQAGGGHHELWSDPFFVNVTWSPAEPAQGAAVTIRAETAPDLAPDAYNIDCTTQQESDAIVGGGTVDSHPMTRHANVWSCSTVVIGGAHGVVAVLTGQQGQQVRTSGFFVIHAREGTSALLLDPHFTRADVTPNGRTISVEAGLSPPAAAVAQTVVVHVQVTSPGVNAYRGFAAQVDATGKAALTIDIDRDVARSDRWRDHDALVDVIMTAIVHPGGAAFSREWHGTIAGAALTPSAG